MHFPPQLGEMKTLWYHKALTLTDIIIIQTFYLQSKLPFLANDLEFEQCTDDLAVIMKTPMNYR